MGESIQTPSSAVDAVLDFVGTWEPIVFVQPCLDPVGSILSALRDPAYVADTESDMEDDLDRILAGEDEDGVSLWQPRPIIPTISTSLLASQSFTSVVAASASVATGFEIVVEEA